MRMGSAYGGFFIGQTIQHSVAFGLHEDNRYFALRRGGFAHRLGYALSSTVLARHDNGSRWISISGIGGAAGGAFISRAWQPPSTASAGDGAVAFGVTMAGRAGLNVLREFVPRLGKFLP